MQNVISACVALRDALLFFMEDRADDCDFGMVPHPIEETHDALFLDCRVTVEEQEKRGGTAQSALNAKIVPAGIAEVCLAEDKLIWAEHSAKRFPGCTRGLIIDHEKRRLEGVPLSNRRNAAKRPRLVAPVDNDHAEISDHSSEVGKKAKSKTFPGSSIWGKFILEIPGTGRRLHGNRGELSRHSGRTGAGMKCLVTGGAGFIGAAVCRHLIGSGCAVVNVDKLTYAANPSSLAGIADHPHYKFYRLDICDRKGLEDVFARDKPDAVMHLAAESHVDRSIGEPAAFIVTNVVGTYQLLEVARDYFEGLPGARADQFRFLHVSTDEVFGSLGPEGTFTEETAYDPNSPYSASKASSDHLVSAWHSTYGLPVLMTNCGNNYGPYQFPEKLIPLIITNAILGYELPVYGHGQNVRDWLHVDDHARALIAVVRQGVPGERYNIGGRNERSNLAVVMAICDYLDRQLPRAKRGSHSKKISFVADRPGHDFRYAIDPSKVEREIGWRPSQSFESGLSSTIDWYLANEAWWREIRAARYDGERLGLNKMQSRPSLGLVSPAPGG